MEAPFVRALVPAYIRESESLLQTTSRRRALEAIRWQSRARSAGTFCFDGTALTYGVPHTESQTPESSGDLERARRESVESLIESWPQPVDLQRLVESCDTKSISEQPLATQSQRSAGPLALSGAAPNELAASSSRDSRAGRQEQVGFNVNESSTGFLGDERSVTSLQRDNEQAVAERQSAKSTPAAELRLNGAGHRTTERWEDSGRPTPERWVDDAGEMLRRGPLPHSPRMRTSARDTPASSPDSEMRASAQRSCAAEGAVSATSWPIRVGGGREIGNGPRGEANGRRVAKASSDRPTTTAQDSACGPNGAAQQSKEMRRSLQLAATSYGNRALRLRLAAPSPATKARASGVGSTSRKKLTVSVPNCSYEPATGSASCHAYNSPPLERRKPLRRKTSNPAQPKRVDVAVAPEVDTLLSPTATEFGLSLDDSLIDTYVASVLAEADPQSSGAYNFGQGRASLLSPLHSELLRPDVSPTNSNPRANSATELIPSDNGGSPNRCGSPSRLPSDLGYNPPKEGDAGKFYASDMINAEKEVPNILDEGAIDTYIARAWEEVLSAGGRPNATVDPLSVSASSAHAPLSARDPPIPQSSTPTAPEGAERDIPGKDSPLLPERSPQSATREARGADDGWAYKREKDLPTSSTTSHCNAPHLGSLSDQSPTAAMRTYGLSSDVAEFAESCVTELRPVASCLREIDMALADLQKELEKEDFI